MSNIQQHALSLRTIPWNSWFKLWAVNSINRQDTSGWRSLSLSVFFTLAALSQVHATHLVGGSMYYDYIGDDQYEVHLVIYRDCGPTNTNGTGFDIQASLAVYEGFDLYFDGLVNLETNGVTNIDLQSGNPCAELPFGVCLERAIYTTVMTLPPSAEPYTIVYQRCCRNPQIINLLDPMNTGFTIFTEIPPALALEDIDVEGNSSPRFDYLPQAYVCVGQPFTLPNPASDIDGDSLFYTIGDVFIGGSFSAPSPTPPNGPPFENVTWADGYAPNTPLGSDEPDWVTIDPSNGTVTGTPSAIGKYVMGIYVNEFRQDDNGNWVNLGKMLRDFTIDVVPCELITPDIAWPDPCSGLDVQFDVDTDEGDFLWDFGAAGDVDTSSSYSPEFSYEEQGEYTVTLSYDLGGCGDTLQFDILIAPPVTSDFDIEPPTCQSGGWLQPVTYSGDAPGDEGTLSWWVDGIASGSGVSPDPLFIPPGSHQISNQLLTEIGCEIEQTLNVELDPLPQASFSMSDPPCNGLEINFSNLSAHADAYQWVFDVSDPNTGLGPESTSDNPTWTYGDYGTFEAQLIAQPGSACADTTSELIIVLPQDPLVLSFGAVEPLACSMQTTVEFTFDGANADDIQWDFGSAGSANGDSVVYDFGAAGLYPVSLTIENDLCGTSQTAEFEVYVPELISEVELVIPNVLTPNADGKNDRFRVGTRRVDDGSVLPTNTASFTQFKLQVFDRWGVLVHMSEGVGAGWDGRIGGNVAAPGTYYFILNADHSCLDADITEVGELTLILD